MKLYWKTGDGAHCVDGDPASIEAARTAIESHGATTWVGNPEPEGDPVSDTPDEDIEEPPGSES